MLSVCFTFGTIMAGRSLNQVKATDCRTLQCSKFYLSQKGSGNLGTIYNMGGFISGYFVTININWGNQKP